MKNSNYQIVVGILKKHGITGATVDKIFRRMNSGADLYTIISANVDDNYSRDDVKQITQEIKEALDKNNDVTMKSTKAVEQLEQAFKALTSVYNDLLDLNKGRSRDGLPSIPSQYVKPMSDKIDTILQSGKPIAEFRREWYNYATSLLENSDLGLQDIEEILSDVGQMIESKNRSQSSIATFPRRTGNTQPPKMNKLTQSILGKR